MAKPRRPNNNQFKNINNKIRSVLLELASTSFGYSKLSDSINKLVDYEVICKVNKEIENNVEEEIWLKTCSNIEDRLKDDYATKKYSK